MHQPFCPSKAEKNLATESFNLFYITLTPTPVRDSECDGDMRCSLKTDLEQEYLTGFLKMFLYTNTVWELEAETEWKYKKRRNRIQFCVTFHKRFKVWVKPSHHLNIRWNHLWEQPLRCEDVGNPFYWSVTSLSMRVKGLFFLSHKSESFKCQLSHC